MNSFEPRTKTKANKEKYKYPYFISNFQYTCENAKGNDKCIPTQPHGEDYEENLSEKDLYSGSKSSTIEPDRGWGWFVCFSSMFINGVVFGIINSFGIIYDRILEDYQTKVPDAAFKTCKYAWIGSVNIGMTFSMSMAVSVLVDKIGVRLVVIFGAILGSCGLIISGFLDKIELLYLTFGGILGIGMAFLYSPSLSILAQYFKRYIGLSNGLVSCGSSIFSIIMSLILPLTISNIGIKYTFVTLGILFFFLIFTAIAFKPTTAEDNEEQMFTKQRLCKMRIWQNKLYVKWVLLLGFFTLSYFVPIVHIVKHTTDVFPNRNGDLLITVMQITSGISRLVSGRVSDIPAINRIRMQQTAVFVFGVATACIPFIETFEILMVLFGIIGVCDGMVVLLVGPIVFDIVGHEDSSQAIGWAFTIISLPMLLGPPAAGKREIIDFSSEINLLLSRRHQYENTKTNIYN
ncbi:hypothetical protein KUTeg_021472 [Tegillarca granosa]|uniref:Monocarboxylate transporter 10 n=1 Tax=Tegillarca granosa TaxID=220873 RepID=A0ABQ9E9H2_TEGGR|nr:hypothetical protein KUTeg_021472 [Tegillarca granosa]